jgi:hypothetical protein
MKNTTDFFPLVQELKEKIEKILKDNEIDLEDSANNKTLQINEHFITFNITCKDDKKIFFVIKKEDKSLIYRVANNQKNLKITKEHISIDYFVTNDLYEIVSLLKN